MHRVHLTHRFDRGTRGDDALAHPLFALLSAIHEVGSIAGAARRLQLSYRHVWGELKRWESELGRALVNWAKGQPAVLTPFGEKLLWAEARAQARLAPQIEALRSELEHAFAVAFDDNAVVLTLAASHDAALPALRDLASRMLNLHLDVRFTGSVDALVALNAGHCGVAGFHALTDTSTKSPTARVFHPLLKPGRHKLLAFARRTQGLIVPPGNPRALASLADVARTGARLANRAPGSGTRVLLDELLARARVDAASIVNSPDGEPSHEAAAAAVASGSADVAFGIEAAARRRGLDFVPLTEERYFLVCLKQALEEAPLRALRGLLADAAWRETLKALPGYAAGDAGQVLPLTRVLPWWNYRNPKQKGRAQP
jgi:molybdate transport repressor ModE-like protein